MGRTSEGADGERYKRRSRGVNVKWVASRRAAKRKPDVAGWENIPEYRKGSASPTFQRWAATRGVTFSGATGRSMFKVEANSRSMMPRSPVFRPGTLVMSNLASVINRKGCGGAAAGGTGKWSG